MSRLGQHRLDIYAERIQEGDPAAVAGSVYASLYFDQTISLVIASIGVPVPIGGAAGDSIAHGDVANCTVDTTLVTITYTGKFPRLCNISAMLSSTPLAGTPLQQFHLEVDNGAGFVEEDVSENQAGGTGRKYFSMEITMTLNPNAVIRLTGQNNTDTANFDLDEFVSAKGGGTSEDFTPATGFLVVAGL